MEPHLRIPSMEKKNRLTLHEDIRAQGDVQTLRSFLIFLNFCRILPVLMVLFICSFIDRSNVGNAKIIGLEKSLDMSSHQYAVGLCVFYATYIASEIPSNLVLKRMTPKVWLPLLTAIWGMLTMCLGFIHNFASFVAVRALLGLAEGGLLPGMILYLSGFYRRGELAFRIGIMYTAVALSGAFGGLLARALSSIGPRGGLEGWRWIFIIEGLATIVCGAVATMCLPNGIESARFLNPEEKETARERLLADTPHDQSFTWSEVRRGVFNLQVWLSSIAYLCINIGLYSFSLFVPTIINNLGFAKDPNEAQLWTVIPYAVASVGIVFFAFLSDRLRVRGTLMLFTLPLAILGYGVISVSSNARIQYGMTFLMGTGIYSSVPPLLSWNSNNSAGHYKRATTSALQLGVANCGGFVASFLYEKRESPLFHRSHSVVLGSLCAAWVFIFGNVAWCWKINRDKARGKYAEFAGSGDDRDPKFRMIL
ncbi:MFS general substrate transporter [Microthyrium microscopicum]|uniref:MFS general substrate transporter n=1 Tax=Microthyrium microscopicum TaxID=703497 RepID=A0A6A6UB84_9PEZI|nr:MFS general substrate transporter [Microthyrium microscopicum]